MTDASARVEEARRRGFFPLVVLLERLVGGPPVGSAGAPDEESIRFRHDPSLSFSTGDVTSVRELELPPLAGADPDAPRRGYEVTTTFLGLTGAVTPLPHYVAEEVAQEDPDAPRTRDFLDLFHHRLLSLLYRGLSRYDLPDTRRSDGTDGWSRRIMALLGIDGGLEGRPAALPGWRVLRLAPLLAERALTAQALAAAIEDALEEDELGDARVAVEPFTGAWVEVASDQLTRLGIQGRLGRDCLVGRRVLDPAGRFRVLIGPLDGEQYRRFAGGEPLRKVEQIIDALVTEPLQHDVVLSLREDAAPALRLGWSRLGKNSWIGGQTRRTTIHAELAA